MKTKYRWLVALAVGLAASACSKKTAGENDRADAMAGAHKHEHRPPHGGTAVVLGKEAYHLELVRDAAAGTLTAYVFDGELENFIRVRQPTIALAATVNGERKELLLAAVANGATGETIGDTSQFEARAAWVKTTGEFDAVLTSIAIRGTTFEAVTFNFPKGNDRD